MVHFRLGQKEFGSRIQGIYVAWHSKKWKWKPWRQQMFRKCWAPKNSEVEKDGRKNSLIWYHKDSNSVQVDLNHTNPNQNIPDESTKIRSKNDSENICEIKKILTSSVNLVHTTSPVPSSPIFLYGKTRDPTSPSYDSSAESVTTKRNHTLCYNPTNSVPNMLADTDSDPSFFRFFFVGFIWLIIQRVL